MAKKKPNKAQIKAAKERNCHKAKIREMFYRQPDPDAGILPIVFTSFQVAVVCGISKTRALQILKEMTDDRQVSFGQISIPGKNCRNINIYQVAPPSLMKRKLVSYSIWIEDCMLGQYFPQPGW